MKVNLKYKIGEKIKSENRIYTVIGFDYIEGRSLRYCLMHIRDGKMEWEYFHEFEIEVLKI